MAKRPRKSPKNGVPADPAVARASIPDDVDEIVMTFPDCRVPLTNLRKMFWPELGLVKRDLIEYYASIANVLLRHIRDRPMVMKRYPDGIHGQHFFMKQAPGHTPDWIQTCQVDHTDKVIEFVLIQDIPSLLWVANLGCIDLNPWYARCDALDSPDYVHFDLDPVEGETTTSFERVCEGALVICDALASLDIPVSVKTTGSRGLHLYVPIVRGPSQKDVHGVAKMIAQALVNTNPKLFVAHYAKSKRSVGTVVVDYNQNAFGQTLASVYSVRPNVHAAVSAPVTWAEVEAGIAVEDFTIRNMFDRVLDVGDLFAHIAPEGDDRVDLDALMKRMES